MALFTNITKKWARGEAQAMKQATTDSLAFLRALTEFHERTRSLAFCPLCFVSYGEPHTFKCPLGTKVSPTDLVSWECPLPDDIAGVLHECPSTFDHPADLALHLAQFHPTLDNGQSVILALARLFTKYKPAPSAGQLKPSTYTVQLLGPNLSYIVKPQEHRQVQRVRQKPLSVERTGVVITEPPGHRTLRRE